MRKSMELPIDSERHSSVPVIGGEQLLFGRMYTASEALIAVAAFWDAVYQLPSAAFPIRK